MTLAKASSALSNENFSMRAFTPAILLKATASKLEALAAYNKYDQDGQLNRELWRKLRQQDEQAVRQLLQQLTKLAQEGKLAAK